MMPALLLTMAAGLPQRSEEPEAFTVKTADETWTRNTKRGAMALAENLARNGRAATCCYTGDGEVFYEPPVGEEYYE